MVSFTFENTETYDRRTGSALELSLKIKPTDDASSDHWWYGLNLLSTEYHLPFKTALNCAATVRESAKWTHLHK